MVLPFRQGVDYAINPSEAELYKLYNTPVDTGLGLTQADLSQSQAGQLSSISDMIKALMAQSGENIRRQYAPLYEQVASEQAARGRLRSPVSNANFNQLRETQAGSIENAINNLMAKSAELQGNVFAQTPQQRLQLASLGLQARGQGLQERSGLADLIQRQKNINQQQGQFERNLAEQSAARREGLAWDREKAGAEAKSRLEAQEGQPSFWEGVGGSALSSLLGGFGGGVGSIAGKKMFGDKQSTPSTPSTSSTPTER